MKTNFLFLLLPLFYFLVLQGHEDLSQELKIIIIDDQGLILDQNDRTALYQPASYEADMPQQLDSMIHRFFGGAFLRMAGIYHQELSEVATYGQGEIHDKVRITLINGILNTRKDIIDSAKLFSETHGGTNVHYIFRPTLGWAWDVVKSTLVKYGFISQQALDLAFAWKRLIHDMGGVMGEGKIIHYAHSIGAADTLTAKCLLSSVELAMISVVTFGSPIEFPDDGFESVVNYASVRDFVPFLRKLRVFVEEGNKIIYVGSYLGIPFIDHLLDNSSYRSVIDKLGQEFIERYTSCEEESVSIYEK